MFTLLVALVIGNFSAQAQLGDLRSRVRVKKDKSEQRDDNSSSSDKRSSSSDESEGSSSKSSKSKGDDEGGGSSNSAPSQADFKENPLPCAVDMYSLLDDGFKLELENKHPYVGMIDIAFLPTKDVNGQPLFKSGGMPKDQEVIVWAIIKDKSGKIIFKEAMDKLGSGNGPVTTFKKHDWHDIEYTGPANGMDAGDYTLEITVTGKPILVYPFKVIVGKNDDPYASLKEIRMMDGAWSKFACYQFEKSNDVFKWECFETNYDMKLKGEKNKSNATKFEYQLYYNGKPFSNLVKRDYTHFRGKWSKEWVTFSLVTDKNQSNYIKSDDMKDGAYLMKVNVDGKGREYPFKIKDGKPVLIDEQDRTKTTDPARALEGLNRTFFVKNVKA